MANANANGKAKNSDAADDVIFGAIDAIVEAAPEPNQHVIEDAAVSSQERRDSVGTIFDSSIHATGSDGEPSVTKTGKFRSRTKARVNNSTLSTKAQTRPQNSGQGDDTDKQQSKVCAIYAANALFTIGQILGGPEWAPVNTPEYSERELIEGSIYDYCLAKGIVDFPPSVALMMALGSYVGPRLFLPSTKARIAKVASYIKGGRDGSQSDSGHDGVGKNDAGQKSGQRIPVPGV